MSCTVRLVQVVKWPFLMTWSKVLFTGLKRYAWYHLDRSVLLLAARSLSAAGCFWLGGFVGLLVRLTCPMPDVDDLLTSSTISPSLTTQSILAVKAAMHPSFHSFPIDMRSPDYR